MTTARLAKRRDHPSLHTWTQTPTLYPPHPNRIAKYSNGCCTQARMCFTGSGIRRVVLAYWARGKEGVKSGHATILEQPLTDIQYMHRVAQAEVLPILLVNRAMLFFFQCLLLSPTFWHGHQSLYQVNIVLFCLNITLQCDLELYGGNQWSGIAL